MKKIFCFVAVLAIFASVKGLHAQSPGTILFCGSEKEDACYFKADQFPAHASKNFSAGSNDNIYGRAYFAGPLGTTKLTVSLYRNGSFYKGRADDSGYDASWSTAFFNLTNVVSFNNTPFPPGSYTLKLSKQTQVIASGTFSVQ